MESDEEGEGPKISENKEEQDLINKAIDVESENKALHMGEVKAIKRLIKGLEWQHKEI